MSDHLVNGLRGTVYDIEADGKILVEFPNMKEKIFIEKVKFDVFDPRRNAVVAVRKQIPLKPAFAMTIHKSQGLTLDRVEVDCQEIFKPGQLGVAIGRARTVTGLRVINFSPRACKKQPGKILNIWAEGDSVNIKEDRTCCNSHIRHNLHESSIYTVQDLMQVDDIQTQAELQEEKTDLDLEDDLEEIMSEISDIEQFKEIKLPEALDVADIIKQVKPKIVFTPIQYENNDIISRIILTKLHVFLKQQYSKLNSFINESPTKKSGQIASKDLGVFFTKADCYSKSSEFDMQSLQLFENECSFTSVHKRICNKIFDIVRSYIIKCKARDVETTGCSIHNRTVTNASRSRIRYVGGYCVAKVRHKYVTKKSTYRYSNKAEAKNEYENAKCAINILNCIKEEEQTVLETTKEPESLLDVFRRQNLNRGLTNIPDCVFNFFIKLTEICLELLTNENLNKMGDRMFSECQRIIHCSDLYQHFVELCSIRQNSHLDEEDSVYSLLKYMALQVTMIETIFTEIIKYHLMVMFSQFRRDVCQGLNIEKKMAHRKQVRVSASSSSTKSHKPKRQPKQCKSAGPERVSVSACSSTSYEHEREPQPGTSTEQETVVPANMPEETSDQDSESDVKCKICYTFEKEENWIQCDSCDAWLHRNCAGLKHHMKWKKYTKKSAKFLCKECE